MVSVVVKRGWNVLNQIRSLLRNKLFFWIVRYKEIICNEVRSKIFIRYK